MRDDLDLVREALDWVGTEDIGSQDPDDAIRLPALEALDRMARTIEQQQARIEGADKALWEIRRFLMTSRNLPPNWGVWTEQLIDMASEALNQNPPNPRSTR